MTSLQTKNIGPYGSSFEPSVVYSKLKPCGLKHSTTWRFILIGKVRSMKIKKVTINDLS